VHKSEKTAKCLRHILTGYSPASILFAIKTPFGNLFIDLIQKAIFPAKEEKMAVRQALTLDEAA